MPVTKTDWRQIAALRQDLLVKQFYFCHFHPNHDDASIFVGAKFRLGFSHILCPEGCNFCHYALQHGKSCYIVLQPGKLCYKVDQAGRGTNIKNNAREVLIVEPFIFLS